MQPRRIVLQCSMLLLLGNYCLDLFGKDEKSKLSPAVRRQVKAGNTNYKKCRTEAFALAKSGELAEEALKTRLSACAERFPGASLYINCKRKAMLSAKGKGKAPAEEIAKCKQLSLEATFDGDASPLPFAFPGGQMVVAGSGFSQSLPVAEHKLAGFDCSPLAEASTADGAKAEYLLFGNHPSLFQGFSGLPASRLSKLLKGKPAAGEDATAEGSLVVGLGKLFGKAKQEGANLFFPVGSCFYQGDLGEHYSGLSLYYLLEGGNGSPPKVVPYFASAFYEKDFSAQTSEQLAEALLAQLNASGSEAGYRAFTRKESPLLTYLTRHELREFDDEGDPRNVCRDPNRQQAYLAVIKSHKTGKKTYPDYILLARTQDLCQFGDRRSAAFIAAAGASKKEGDKPERSKKDRQKKR